MKSCRYRINSILRGPKVGIVLVVTLLLGTIGVLAFNSKPFAFAAFTLPAVVSHPALEVSGFGVKLKAQLANPKLIQGSDGKAFLRVKIDVPEFEATNGLRRASDVLVVLDKSGSMAADNRLPYAKQAILDLLGRLNEEDRFALVAFDSRAEVISNFHPVTSHNRALQVSRVSSMTPGSGTNMGEGIRVAKRLLESRGNESGRSRKVIMLSDGQANEGVTSMEGLGEMVSAYSIHEAVVSTIGMGLGFNEGLMSFLADQGGGTFSYLEHLEKLNEIFARDLSDARKVFAASGSLELNLPAAIKVVDAAGYPIEQKADTTRIKIGQLLSGASKQFFITLQAPTHSVGSFDLGDIALTVGQGSRSEQLKLSGKHLVVSVIEPSRLREARSALDQEAFKEAWIRNNFGYLQKEVREEVLTGNKLAAQKRLDEYRRQLDEAELASGLSLNEPLASKLNAAQSELDDAFTGAVRERELKQNRFGKSSLADAIQNQRGLGN